MSRLYIVAQSFHIYRKDFDECFNTLKTALMKPYNLYGNLQDYSALDENVKLNDLEKVNNIIELFELCRFKVKLNEVGSIVFINDSIGEFITLRKWFFEIIAPFVLDDSYIEFRNTIDDLNDNEDTYMLFRDKKMILYRLMSTKVEYTYYNHEHGNIETTHIFD